jgi:5-methylcytosine-specific restriction protein B
MSFPKNITKENLLKAIDKIDKEGIPKDAQSAYYDVVFNNKLYPPKVVVSFANIYANGSELDRNSFSGGINTLCFKLLEQFGFIIQEKKNQMN